MNELLHKTQNIYSTFLWFCQSAHATAQDVIRQRGDVTTVSSLGNGFRVASHSNGRPTATVS
jgi:hypothetical protein